MLRNHSIIGTVSLLVYFWTVYDNYRHVFTLIF